MNKLDQKGFTLIEIIVVIAMMSIMMLAAGYYLGNQGRQAQLKSAARDLISNMNLARISAIRDSRPWAIKFDKAANSYTISRFTGALQPTEPLDWSDAAVSDFRTVSLPETVSFGSNFGPTYDMNNIPVGNGITYANDRIVFYPNGTGSETGAVYVSDFTAKDMVFSSFAISTLKSTGRVKGQSGSINNGWAN